MEQYWDDVSGGFLDPVKVRKARQLEIDEVHLHEIYTKVPLEDCWCDTDKPPITLRWLDTNKGDHVNEKGKNVDLTAEELFENTPPTEMLKFLLSIAISKIWSKLGKPLKVTIVDIKRAFFHARPRCKIYVDLPREDAEDGKCGLLLK
eukprot:4435830-Amphidinium_carterae.3